MLATMNQIVNLLSGFQKKFPPTNNQLRSSSNSRSHATVHDGQIVTETVQRKAPSNVGNTGTRGTQSYGLATDNKGKLVICYNCRGEGHVSRQCKEKKRLKDSQYFKDKMLLMEAKEKGAVLDAEAEGFLADVECTAPYDQPLAITTTNNFEVSHEDAYDSDVDEGPHAPAAFMANLSSTSGTNGATTSHVNEEEHLDSDVESDIDDNMISYHRYQLNSEVQVVPTEAEVSRTKMSNRPRTIKPINYAELNALYSHFVPQKELSREQVYWLPVEELATQKSNPPKPKQLQRKDDTIKKLQTQINNMSILNVKSTVELSTSNSHSRDTLTRKLTALIAENAKLKSESLSKMHSEPIVPEKPKVLAPGMGKHQYYAFSLFKRLGHGNLKPINMVIEMADRFMQSPKGIIENVLVKINKFIFPIGFIILDIIKDDKVPIILGRPMLVTAYARIDVSGKKISLEVRTEHITFNINERESPAVISPVRVINNFLKIDKIDESRNLEELLMSDNIDGDLSSFLEDNDLFPDLESQDITPPGPAILNEDSSRMFCNPNSDSIISIDDFVEMDDIWDNLDFRDLNNEATKSPVKLEFLSSEIKSISIAHITFKSLAK
nr:hypothetical protein [Tanacetum cinerariifolium]